MRLESLVVWLLIFVLPCAFISNEDKEGDGKLIRPYRPGVTFSVMSTLSTVPWSVQPSAV
jgi:hypothetical protein